MGNHNFRHLNELKMKTVFCFLCWAGSFCLANSSDVNMDHNVNLQDFYFFSNCWQSQAGNPDYNNLCDLSTPKDQVIDVNDLIVFADNWLWNAIRVDIYSNGLGYYANTVWLEGEGKGTFQFVDLFTEDYELPGYEGNYYAYASHRGDFTEIFTFKAEDITPPIPPWADPTFEATVEVDLDPINPDQFNGTIFLTQPFFVDSYLANTEVNVLDWDTLQPIALFATDSQGRFSIELEEGDYLFSFYEGSEQHIENAFVSGSYQDYRYPSFTVLLKPNIYLYPQTIIDLTVALNFPSGGNVTASEPKYINRWQVTVEPSGLIDGLYEYLFYESVQPDYGQYEAGWVVAQDGLEDFFRSNLAQTGFIQKEINDFIEYWIPLLNTSPYYAIYPQYSEQLDNMAQLIFSRPPDNLIRLIYSVREIPTNSLKLPPPHIPEFSRNGFTVAEWGVSLK